MTSLNGPPARLACAHRSIGLTTGPPIAPQGHAATAAVEGGPLSLLQDASSSRLLYSLMIVEHLLSRDMSTPLIVADVPPSGGNGGERSLEQQQQQHASGHDERNSVATAVRLAAIAAFTGGGGLTESATEIKPSMNGVAGQEPATATAGGGGDGNSDGDWEVYQPAAFGVGGGASGDFVAGCGGVDVGEVVGGGGAKIDRRTWRDRFVGSGGIDALVELVLTRDWDATRGCRDCGGEGRGWPGESTAAISLACLALLLVLLERFMEEGYLPEPRQLTRLVRRRLLA